MPTPTRNALNAVAFLPGVNTTGTNRDSTINGLPEGFLSITLDGVSNNDNFLRNTDGFFASVTPRQDAVEAVSVTLAAAGAQVGGGAGAVTMAFQTRSGGNRFTGSAYEYYRNPSFNSNYYFNEVNHQGKNEVKLNTFGGRVGGPIVIPGLYDGRDKAFFFGHYEQIRFPNSFTRTRTVFNPRVADGWFRYQFGTEVREVNLLQLAAANGQISAKDPTMLEADGPDRRGHQDDRHAQRQRRSALRLVRVAEPGDAVRAPADGPSRLQPHRQPPPERIVDADHRQADPGLPEQRRSAVPRRAEPARLRVHAAADVDGAALGAVEEHRQRAARRAHRVRGRLELRLSVRRSPRATIRRTFADGGGFAITTPGDTTDWHTSNAPSWRAAPTYSIDETLTWQRNAHTMTFGGNLLISNAESSGQQIVPRHHASASTPTSIRPTACSTPTNFPGASSAQLTAARNTYAVLTGRVASVNSQAVLDESGKYVELAPSTLPGGMKVYGMFAQDSWRVRPNLTLTGGIRYDVLTPFKPCSNVMSVGDDGEHLRPVGRRQRRHSTASATSSSPARRAAATPEYILLEEGSEGYKTDLNNFAPSASIAWRPDVQSGFLRTLLGDPSQATLRAGYSEAYERQGLTRVHRSLRRQPRRARSR